MEIRGTEDGGYRRLVEETTFAAFVRVCQRRTLPRFAGTDHFDLSESSYPFATSSLQGLAQLARSGEPQGLRRNVANKQAPWRS